MAAGACTHGRRRNPRVFRRQDTAGGSDNAQETLSAIAQPRPRREHVNRGFDRVDADTAIKALVLDGGIAANSVYKLTVKEPPSKKELGERTKLELKNKFLRIKTEADPAGGVGLRGFQHSGFGGGTFFAAETIKKSWAGGKPPDPPAYDMDAAEPDGTVVKRDTSAQLTPAARAAASLGRRARKRQSSGGRKMDQARAQDARKEEAGIRLCSETNAMSHRCSYQASTAKQLERHMASGRHTYRGGRTSMDAFLQMVSDPAAEMNAIMLRKGAMPNVGKEADATIIADTDVERVRKCNDAFECGHAAKRQRRATYRKHPDLLAAMEEMFMRGERAGKAMKPDAAHKEMRDRQETAATVGPRTERIGMRYFSNRSAHGKLLTEATIKSWFSIRTRKRKLDAIAATDAASGGSADQVANLAVAQLRTALTTEFEFTPAELNKLEKDGLDEGDEHHRNKAALIHKLRRLRSGKSSQGDRVDEGSELEDIDVDDDSDSDGGDDDDSAGEYDDDADDE